MQQEHLKRLSVAIRPELNEKIELMTAHAAINDIHTPQGYRISKRLIVEAALEEYFSTHPNGYTNEIY